MTRLFGTDGIRGRAGEGPLAEGATSAIGRAVGCVLRDVAGANSKAVLLAHDGRRSGPGLEAALARGLAAAGLEPQSAGLLPTPGLAYLTRMGEFACGMMISASHNPARDNGLKVFDSRGEKLSDAIEDDIESTYRESPTPVDEGQGPTHDPEHERAYLARLTRAVQPLDLAGMHVVVDCANGAGSRVAPHVFGRLGARVTSIAAEPDGENINFECGSTHPNALQVEVRRTGAAIGIALDGDGDRCLLVDEHGALVDGDGIMTVMGTHMKRAGRLAKNTLVATVMSNRGLHRALKREDIRVHTVGVGDRQVVDALRSEALDLGGEQSGHMIFGEWNHMIGDGTFTALAILQAMRESDASLAELAAPFQAFPQVLVNVPVTEKRPFAELAEVGALAERVEAELEGNGRVLLRYSGTENLARVMVEGPEAGWIRDRAERLAQLIADQLGA